MCPSSKYCNSTYPRGLDDVAEKTPYGINLGADVSRAGIHYPLFFRSSDTIPVFKKFQAVMRLQYLYPSGG